MAQTPKFVYFDIGGVIINWGKYLEGLATILNTPNDKAFAEYWNQLDGLLIRGKIEPQELWIQMQQKYKSSNNIDYVNFWVEIGSKIPETMELIDSISKNYNLGILSNIFKHLTSTPEISKIINQDRFSVAIESWKEGYAKPDSEIYKLSEQKSGFQGEQILLIDDNKAFIDKAKEFNWQTYLFNTNSPDLSVNELTSLLLP